MIKQIEGIRYFKRGYSDRWYSEKWCIDSRQPVLYGPHVLVRVRARLRVGVFG